MSAEKINEFWKSTCKECGETRHECICCEDCGECECICEPKVDDGTIEFYCVVCGCDDHIDWKKVNHDCACCGESYALVNGIKDEK